MSESSGESQVLIRSAMFGTRVRPKGRVTVQAGYTAGRWTGTSVVMVSLAEQVRLPLADVELLLIGAGCVVHAVGTHSVTASPSVAVYDALAAADVAFDLLDQAHSRGGPAGRVVPWRITPCRDSCEHVGCDDQELIDPLSAGRGAA